MGSNYQQFRLNEPETSRFYDYAECFSALDCSAEELDKHADPDTFEVLKVSDLITTTIKRMTPGWLISVEYVAFYKE